MNVEITPTESEVKAAVVRILTTALLKIRLDGSLGDHKSCEIEADHIHNLPGILLEYADELIEFYYNTERKIYIAQCGGKYPASYDSDWAVLAERLQSVSKA